MRCTVIDFLEKTIVFATLFISVFFGIQNFQNSLEEGTSVVIGGGIYGTVKKIDLATGVIEVKIADGVVIRVDKGSVFKDPSSTPMQNK